MASQNAIQPEGQQWLARLAAFLGRTQLVDEVLTADPDHLTEEAKKNLKRIDHHFNPPKSRSRKAKGAPAAGEEAEQPDNRGLQDIHNPWRRVLAIRSLDDHLTVAINLMDCGIDARYPGRTQAQVLLGLVTGAAVQGGEGAGEAGGAISESNRPDEPLPDLLSWTKQEDLAFAFKGRINYTVTVRDDADISALRQRFTWLMWYDFTKIINPNETGQRFGAKTKRDIAAFVRSLDPETHNEQDVLKTLHDIQLWCRYGKRLHALCEVFGEGCLFVLIRFLSTHFITRGRMYINSRTFQEAMDHLDDLHLHDTLRANPAIQRTAKEMRQVLCGVFTDHLNAYVEEKSLRGGEEEDEVDDDNDEDDSDGARNSEGDVDDGEP